MVYAYITNAGCSRIKAFMPGEKYQGIPVSKHEDLWQWGHGKKATLRLADRSYACDEWIRKAARAVAEMRGWE